MALLVLRSLAVYAGTAALAVWLVHRFVVPVRRRVGLVLALAPLIFTGRAMLTGGVYAGIDILYGSTPFEIHRAEMGIGRARSPVLSDVVSQMIPWMAADAAGLRAGPIPALESGQHGRRSRSLRCSSRACCIRGRSSACCSRCRRRGRS